MAISHELILEPSDISRISVQCVKCKLRVEVAFDFVSGHGIDFFAKCPKCEDDWGQVRNSIEHFDQILRELQQGRVLFHVAEPGSLKG